MSKAKKRGRRSKERPAGDVREFLLKVIAAGRKDPTAAAVDKFGITRVTAYYHLRELRKTSRIRKTGSTRDARWEVIEADTKAFSRTAATLTEEYGLWQEEAEAFLQQRLSENVLGIVRHGFTEMVNNVIDHSEFRRVEISISVLASQIVLEIRDDGVGIFNKIQQALKLKSPLDSVSELHKGKLTTDPSRHSGEGIFFTSRMFDRFEIRSAGIRYVKDNLGDDWHLGQGDVVGAGTLLEMSIAVASTTRREDIFRAFTSEDADGIHQFDTTEILVGLSTFGMGDLVSRSQAKRVLATLEKFRRIILDFRGIQSVGQGFADEVLRVFPAMHPKVIIEWRNANEAIDFMLKRSKPKR